MRSLIIGVGSVGIQAFGLFKTMQNNGVLESRV